ncbi:6,7-dimethyl-8-ribityllumazine synthase [Nocardia goodfellowii]|uniref:6,7-dimethyl-8-ribityllumazine synthase n=1 Tax=Nocardia goodfellowii TaxID=882446 RepID=A0ABS4QQA7_9NOCA|nr:6,7-dimethyl-8-ribityllumazine synthase [Nocardia goodfellowii]MBP2193870.1 6,7-dimethyl-8-ribityllumazine synthase [Nocardia goodfellowii]
MNNKVAFIRAMWHSSIVGKALEGFTAEYRDLGFDPAAIDVFEVPGAFEIPLHAKRLAQSGRYSAIVASALVVDGGIYRHDFVASAVIDGLMRVQLDSDVPVFSVVLTPHHFHEHSEHVNYYTEHFVTKGAEAARALATTLNSLRALPVD